MAILARLNRVFNHKKELDIMKIKAIFTAIAGSIAISCNAYAADSDVCPSADLVKAQGLVIAQDIAPGYYVAMQNSNYNTDKSWIFGFGIINADDEQSALSKSNKILKNLSGEPTPLHHNDELACVYDLVDHGERYMAIAVNGDFTDAPSLLRSHFKAIA
jgi:hypothetical protein